MSESLWPRGLQHARLPCPSLCPRVCSNSCPLSQWCYLTITSSVTFFFLPSIFSQNQGVFQWVESLHQVVKVMELQYQSFWWVFRVDFHLNWLVWSPCSATDSQESSPPLPLLALSSRTLLQLHIVIQIKQEKGNADPLRLTLFPPSPREQVYCSLMVPLAKFEEHPFHLSVCVCVYTYVWGWEKGSRL